MSAEQITFQVQGSAPEPYIVVFTKAGTNLTVTCTCQAAEMGQTCKHRLGILDGNVEGLVSPNKEEVKKVISWLIGTDLETALMDMAVNAGSFALLARLP